MLNTLTILKSLTHETTRMISTTCILQVVWFVYTTACPRTVNASASAFPPRRLHSHRHAKISCLVHAEWKFDFCPCAARVFHIKL